MVRVSAARPKGMTVRRPAGRPALAGVLALLLALLRVPGADAGHATVEVGHAEAPSYTVAFNVGAPLPLPIGRNAVLLLVRRRGDGVPVRDARVLVTVAPLDHSGRPAGRPATYPAPALPSEGPDAYGATVDLPTAGRWQLTVLVDGQVGLESTTVAVHAEDTGRYRTLLVVLAFPLAAVALFCWSTWHARRPRGRRRGSPRR